MPIRARAHVRLQRHALARRAGPLAIYRELFAEHGRPLTEDEYFGRARGPLGGGDHRRLARRRRAMAPALVEERIDRYVAVADGSTVPGESARRSVTPPSASRSRSSPGPTGARSSPCSRRRARTASSTARRGRRRRARQARSRGLPARARARSATARPETWSPSRTPRPASRRRRPPGCTASPCSGRSPTSGSRRPTSIVDAIDVAARAALLG